MEAFINGIPVLACDRGGLPEVMAEAGFTFAVPPHYTPESRVCPTAEEVAPRVDTIIRLWDDEKFYEAQRQRCLAAAQGWQPERVISRYEAFLTGIIQAAREREGDVNGRTAAK